MRRLLRAFLAWWRDDSDMIGLQARLDPPPIPHGDGDKATKAPGAKEG